VEILQDMSRNIKNFSDRDDGIRNLILTGGRQFSNNPREMKRFVNVFRFFYFLRAAREARKEPVPSLQQMSRWIVLSLRWPELVRWLRRGNLAKGSSSDPVLGAFERLASESSDLAAWLNGADSSFGLRAGEVPWLSDGNLFEFFRVESGFAAGQRLSDATGKGFW